MTKLIWLIKNMPIFIFDFINIFLLLIICLSYITEITEPSLSWGAEGLGWRLNNPWNYTFYCLIWVLFLIITIYFSIKLRCKHLFAATMISFSSVVGFIADYMYHMELLTGQALPFV